MRCSIRFSLRMCLADAEQRNKLFRASSSPLGRCRTTSTKLELLRPILPKCSEIAAVVSGRIENIPSCSPTVSSSSRLRTSTRRRRIIFFWSERRTYSCGKLSSDAKPHRRTLLLVLAAHHQLFISLQIWQQKGNSPDINKNILNSPRCKILPLEIIQLVLEFSIPSTYLPGRCAD